MARFVMVLIGMVLFVGWLWQLIVLMNMKDDEFPGKHDKTLWFVAVFVGSVVGALAFVVWRVVRSGEAASADLADEIGGVIGRSKERGAADEKQG